MKKIIAVQIDICDRRDLENIDSERPTTVKDLVELLGVEREDISIYDLETFVTDSNDEMIDLNDVWLGYATIKDK